ncbi:peptide/nickel transport system substrate-binding protein [Rhizobiales bacterium GAS191]|nr:peptide/nickel transport system substrate-binding protein [Rhizobiales bacterium GAS191]
MQRRSFLASALAASATLAAPSLMAAPGSRVLKFIPQADLAVLDPIWTTAYVTRNHAYLVFDTLYGWDSHYRAQPQMVEGHRIEDDGKLWRLTLRPGLRFHDGAPVLARDCVASLLRWSKRDNYGRRLMGATEELSAPDDRVIQFRLRQPFPQLPEALGKATNNMAAIMPARLAATDPFQQVPELIGSGPFRFKADERMPGAHYAYERFAEYQPRPAGVPDWTAGPKIVNFDRIEWQVVSDAATAAAALRLGEFDWWELPSPDLIPMLRANPALKVEVQDPTGFIGIFRMNHLHPPFDNAAIRRALLGAVNQAEFMQAAGGDDPTIWKDGVGYFCPGTPMASTIGIEALTKPRDLAKARDEVKAAGYDGRKIVLLGATDVPILKAAADVTADLMQRLGFNVDYVATDWGTVVQRRTRKDPPEKGGWNLYSNFTGGMDQTTPTTHTNLWSGTNAAPGWPSSVGIEQLSSDWLEAPDQATQARIAAEIQRQAFLDVPYIPLGQIAQPTVYRAGISGVMPGFAVFWNVKRD